jgi:hypothetical protein
MATGGAGFEPIEPPGDVDVPVVEPMPGMVDVGPVGPDIGGAAGLPEEIDIG